MRFKLLILFSVWATAGQAQFLDQDSADCVAASNAPQVAEADGMTFQSAEARTPRVTWVVWEDTVDFCIRASTYTNRDQGRFRVNALSEWMGNNVMDIAGAGPYASMTPVERVAAIFEERVERRCGDDRSCRAENAVSVVSSTPNNQVSYGQIGFESGSVTLIFIGGDLIGGVLERNGSAPAEVRFRELQ